MSLDDKSTALLADLRELERVLVALSGGVDSAFLLWAAVQALGAGRVLAVTATTSICFEQDQARAADLAERLGVRHRLVPTPQLDDERFVSNPPDRCYVCKRIIFEQLWAIAHQENMLAVIEGSNWDDREEYRPGAQAAQELGVLSPLERAQLTKDEIRTLSRQAGLPTWNLPAQTCLATRFPPRRPITAAGLDQVRAAEAFLHDLGCGVVRVRHHGDVARIEVPPEVLPRLIEPVTAAAVSAKLKALGFRYVALDLDGYRRGSLEESNR